MSTACRTSAPLADFDLAHWDTAGTASVKITLFCLWLSTKTAFLPPFFLFNLTAPVVLLKEKSSLLLLSVCDVMCIPAVIFPQAASSTSAATVTSTGCCVFELPVWDNMALGLCVTFDFNYMVTTI